MRVQKSTVIIGLDTVWRRCVYQQHRGPPAANGRTEGTQKFCLDSDVDVNLYTYLLINCDPMVLVVTGNRVNIPASKQRYAF